MKEAIAHALRTRHYGPWQGKGVGEVIRETRPANSRFDGASFDVAWAIIDIVIQGIGIVPGGQYGMMFRCSWADKPQESYEKQGSLLNANPAFF